MKPKTLAQLITAGALLAQSAWHARDGEVSPFEEKVFRTFNQAPDRIETNVWIVMQGGNFAAVPIVAGLVGLRRGSAEGSLVAAAGTSTWLIVKLIKVAVRRGRPEDHLCDVIVRGRPQAGLGYPSGHAAVALTLALTVAPHGFQRVLAVVAAGLAAGGRLYAGAHLPLDVAGGLALGALVGTAATAVGE